MTKTKYERVLFRISINKKIAEKFKALGIETFEESRKFRSYDGELILGSAIEEENIFLGLIMDDLFFVDMNIQHINMIQDDRGRHFLYITFAEEKIDLPDETIQFVRNVLGRYYRFIQVYSNTNSTAAINLGRMFDPNFIAGYQRHLRLSENGDIFFHQMSRKSK